MPKNTGTPRRDKLAKLVAVFDEFHKAIAGLDDPLAREMIEYWQRLRHNYVAPTKYPRSSLAGGMEQGLRETPMLLARMPEDARKKATHALYSAIAAEYPEFHSKDAERLSKIKARGSIRGENEYYLVRHRIDELEGKEDGAEELQQCYALVDKFDANGA